MRQGYFEGLLSSLNGIVASRNGVSCFQYSCDFTLLSQAIAALRNRYEHLCEIGRVNVDLLNPWRCVPLNSTLRGI
jgi:hypothetical protein